MRTSFLAQVLSLGLCLGLALACAPEQKKATPGSIKVEALKEQDAVLGELTVPLGTVVTIEADVIDGSKYRAKALEGVLLLHVISVNGQKLQDSPELRFKWFR